MNNKLFLWHDMFYYYYQHFLVHLKLLVLTLNLVDLSIFIQLFNLINLNMQNMYFMIMLIEFFILLLYFSFINNNSEKIIKLFKYYIN